MFKRRFKDKVNKASHMPSFTVLLHNVHSYNLCLRKSSLWQQMENILHLDGERSGEHLAAKVL